MLTIIPIVTIKKISKQCTNKGNEENFKVHFKKSNAKKKRSGRIEEHKKIYMENKEQNVRKKSFTISNHVKCK